MNPFKVNSRNRVQSSHRPIETAARSTVVNQAALGIACKDSPKSSLTSCNNINVCPLTKLLGNNYIKCNGKKIDRVYTLINKILNLLPWKTRDLLRKNSFWIICKMLNQLLSSNLNNNLSFPTSSLYNNNNPSSFCNPNNLSNPRPSSLSISGNPNNNYNPNSNSNSVNPSNLRCPSSKGNRSNLSRIFRLNTIKANSLGVLLGYLMRSEGNNQVRIHVSQDCPKSPNTTTYQAKT